MLNRFYESSCFGQDACTKVVLQEQDAVDDGGVHQQFYLTIYEGVANGQQQILEGPSTRVRPVVKPSNIVGKARAHSLVMNNMGFSYLSPPIYHYLVGSEDEAITCLIDLDVSGQAFHIISKVSVAVIALSIIMMFLPYS